MGAFRYSEERNKYRGYRMDAATFTADIESQRWVVLEGTIILDEPTLCSLASLSLFNKIWTKKVQITSF
ncbi:hypothetical protein [Brevibacillus laterosporus]